MSTSSIALVCGNVGGYVPPLFPNSSSFVKSFSHKVITLYHHHSAFLHQITLLALTACVFISKVWHRLPKLISRTSLVLLNYVGIIHLHSQILHLCKSCKDMHRALAIKDTSGILTLAAKIAVKAIDILLTCASFAFALCGLVGFPQVSVAARLLLRPLGIVSLALGALNSTIDYYQNKDLLENLRLLKPYNQHNHRRSLTLLVRKILHLIAPQEAIRLAPLDLPTSQKEEKILSYVAICTVRQLEESSLREFNQDLALQLQANPHFTMDFEKNLRYLKGMKRRIKEKNKQMTVSSLLAGLGWVSLGVGRLYPDSLADWAMRTGMSSIYTAKMAWKKYTLYRLAKEIA